MNQTQINNRTDTSEDKKCFDSKVWTSDYTYLVLIPIYSLTVFLGAVRRKCYLFSEVKIYHQQENPCLTILRSLIALEFITKVQDLARVI